LASAAYNLAFETTGGVGAGVVGVGSIVVSDMFPPWVEHV
jgi:hypothetical protein